MKRKKRRCSCGRYYVPADERDNVCDDCRKWWILAAHEKDVLKYERVRMLYNSENKSSLTYGQFEQKLYFIERRIKAR